MFLKSYLRRSFGASAITRNPKFKVLGDKDISFFEKITSVITDPSMIEPYNQDWTKKYQGQSKLMLKPKSNEEVAEILKYCNQE